MPWIRIMPGVYMGLPAAEAEVEAEVDAAIGVEQTTGEWWDYAVFEHDADELA
jgi:hypothetical protein